MKLLMRIFAAMRMPEWFFSKLPLLLMLGIVAADMTDPTPRSIAKKSLVWMAAIAAMALLGYVVNDHFDRDCDARSKKRSSVLPPAGVLLACSAAVGVELLLLVIGRPFAFAAAVVSNLIAVAYSSPPLRLKERGVSGVVADSFAACVAPAAVVIGVAWPRFPFVEHERVLFVAAAFVWMFLFGARGIIVHQMWDASRDAAAGLRTLVVRVGAERARAFAGTVVFPLEVVAFVTMIAAIPAGLAARLATIAAYVAYDVFRRWQWRYRLHPLPPARGYIAGSELVEIWLPLLQVGLLVGADRRNVYVAAAWLLLFHSAIVPRARDLAAAVLRFGAILGAPVRRVVESSRLVRVGIVIAGALLLLEAALQAGALVVWARHRPAPAAVPANADVVLCIGDSFTYGFGASDRNQSYPAQLQRIVDAARPGHRVRVANQGWPGQSSYDVALRLNEQLAKNRPRLVYVIVGANDTWSRPAVLRGPASPLPRFELRWRTLRLVEITATAFAKRAPESNIALASVHARRAPEGLLSVPSSPASPFPGTWYAGRDPFVFGADHLLRFGTVRLHWEVAGERLFMMPDATSREFRWSLSGDRLILRMPGEPDWVLTRAPAPAPEICSAGSANLMGAASEGWDALGRGNLDRAAACLQTATRSPLIEASARSGLVVIDLRRDQRENAARELQRVRAAYAAHPSPFAAQSLVEATGAISEIDGLAQAREMLKLYPRNASLWKSLGWYSFQHGSRAEAVAALDNAVAFSGESTNRERAYFRYLRSIATREERPEDALRDLIDSFQDDPNEQVFISTIQLGRVEFTPERFERVLSRSSVDGATRERLRSMFNSAHGPQQRLGAVLEANLRQIVAACRRSGATVVLASYPFAFTDVDTTAERVAADLDVPWLNLHDEFDRRLEGRPRSELFVADGHCNDHGYRLMAELIGHDLIERVSR